MIRFTQDETYYSDNRSRDGDYEVDRGGYREGGTVCLGSRNLFFYVFIVCSFYLARLEDMANRRTLLKDERLSSKIE